MYTESNTESQVLDIDVGSFEKNKYVDFTNEQLEIQAASHIKIMNLIDANLQEPEGLMDWNEAELLASKDECRDVVIAISKELANRQIALGGEDISRQIEEFELEFK